MAEIFGLALAVLDLVGKRKPTAIELVFRQVVAKLKFHKQPEKFEKTKAKTEKYNQRGQAKKSNVETNEKGNKEESKATQR